jgi:hypothetical protein
MLPLVRGRLCLKTVWSLLAWMHCALLLPAMPFRVLSQLAETTTQAMLDFRKSLINPRWSISRICRHDPAKFANDF